MMPFVFADVGESYIIKKVSGSPELKKHMKNLGFVPGAEITAVTQTGGNWIVNIKESRVAVSEEMAKKIFV